MPLLVFGSQPDKCSAAAAAATQTASCKKRSESPDCSSSLIGHKNIFVTNQKQGIRTLLELVRKEEVPKGLFPFCSKRSPRKFYRPD